MRWRTGSQTNSRKRTLDCFELRFLLLFFLLFFSRLLLPREEASRGERRMPDPDTPPPPPRPYLSSLNVLSRESRRLRSFWRLREDFWLL